MFYKDQIRIRFDRDRIWSKNVIAEFFSNYIINKVCIFVSVWIFHQIQQLNNKDCRIGTALYVYIYYTTHSPNYIIKNG